MAQRNPEDVAAKWAQRTAGASADYAAGIQRVSEAPGAAAARKEQKYQAGVTAAITSGKWRTRVAAVSLNDWQTAATNKGAARLAQGAQAAQPKMAQAMGRILPAIEAVKAEVSKMPDLTTEDRINKSAAFQRGMNKRLGGGK